MPRTRWEYLQLHVWYAHDAPRFRRHYEIREAGYAPREIANAEDLLLIDQLAALGADGWEMVLKDDSIGAAGPGTEFPAYKGNETGLQTFIFKRPAD